MEKIMVDYKSKILLKETVKYNLATLMGKLGRKRLNESILAITAIKLAINYIFQFEHIFETMYHGVPVVGIPLFGDHYDTMIRVQAKGMGILLEWKTVTEGELYEALVKVINNPR